MHRIYNRIIKALLILSFGMLPGSAIECDLEDGEFELDLDEIWYDYDDYYYEDDYYYDYWYDDWWEPCCW